MSPGPEGRSEATGETSRGHAVRDLVDADRELALLRELIQAASSGPGVEPLAAAAARMIPAATGTAAPVVSAMAPVAVLPGA